MLEKILNKQFRSLFQATKQKMNNDQEKTFKAKRNFDFLQNSAKRNQLNQYIVKTLGCGDMLDAVRLPKDQDRNEWLAINTIDFYNQINLIYGVLRDICTQQKCPLMSAGKKFEYLWAADTKSGKPQALSAPEYVTNLMEWIERQLDNPNLFPHTGKFPATFETQTIRTIFKRMFRVYAHIYHSHAAELEANNEHQHFNTCFKHFILFVHEFKLVDEAELRPLEKIIQQIIPQSTTTTK